MGTGRLSRATILLMRRRLLAVPALALTALVALAAPAAPHLQVEAEEGSYPAPRLVLAPNPNPTTTSASTTTTTEATTSTSQRRAGTTLESEQRDDGSQDATPWLVGSGIAAVLAVGAGGWVLKRRTDRTS